MNRLLFCLFFCSSVFIAVPAFGDACCLHPGVCQDLTPDECSAQHGYLFGVGTSCAEVSCPPQGACEFNEGDAIGCFDGTELQCRIFGNSYEGDGTSCLDPRDTSPEGACCQWDGTCILTRASYCTEGIFHGPNTSCDDVDCTITGACCTADACGISCSVVPAARCLGIHEVFKGEGTTCEDDTCEAVMAEIGGCCLISGDCLSSIQRSHCFALSGEFSLDNADCHVVCTQIVGRCYRPNGICEMRRFLDCVDELAGYFQNSFIDDTCPDLSGNPIVQGYCCTEMNPQRDRWMSRENCRTISGYKADAFVESLAECTEALRESNDACVIKEEACPITLLPFFPFVMMIGIRLRSKYRRAQ